MSVAVALDPPVPQPPRFRLAQLYRFPDALPSLAVLLAHGIPARVNGRVPRPLTRCPAACGLCRSLVGPGVHHCDARNLRRAERHVRWVRANERYIAAQALTWEECERIHAEDAASRAYRWDRDLIAEVRSGGVVFEPDRFDRGISSRDLAAIVAREGGRLTHDSDHVWRARFARWSPRVRDGADPIAPNPDEHRHRARAARRRAEKRPRGRPGWWAQATEDIGRVGAKGEGTGTALRAGRFSSDRP